jgi:hypothetical protein
MFRCTHPPGSAEPASRGRRERWRANCTRWPSLGADPEGLRLRGQERAGRLRAGEGAGFTEAGEHGFAESLLAKPVLLIPWPMTAGDSLILPGICAPPGGGR